MYIIGAVEIALVGSMYSTLSTLLPRDNLRCRHVHHRCCGNRSGRFNVQYAKQLFYLGTTFAAAMYIIGAVEIALVGSMHSTLHTLLPGDNLRCRHVHHRCCGNRSGRFNAQYATYSSTWGQPSLPPCTSSVLWKLLW
jgi:hypothetical protein